MTRDEKFNKMYDMVVEIKTIVAEDRVKSKQLRKEMDAANEKIEEHEKTQTKAYVIFASVGSVFIFLAEWLFKRWD